MISFLLLLFIVSIYSTTVSTDTLFTNSDLHQLTSNQVQENGLVGIYLIGFYKDDCTTCDEFSKNLSEYSKYMKNIITVSSFNCLTNEDEVLHSFCKRYEVTSMPSIKLIVDGQKVYDYNGPVTNRDINLALSTYLPNKILAVTGTNIDYFVSSKDLKVILFSEKLESPILYKTLTSIYKDIKFGQASKTSTELIAKYNIKKFPSLILLSNENKQYTYDSKITPSGLKGWLNDIVDELNDDTYLSILPLIKDGSCYYQHCLDTNKLCAFLVTPFGSKLNGKYIKVMKAASEELNKLSDLEASFSWFDGNDAIMAQWISNSFKVQDSSIPQVFAFSPKKKRASSFTGSFDAKEIAVFLVGVDDNSVKSYAYRNEKLPVVENPACSSESYSNQGTTTNPDDNLVYLVDLTVNNFERLVLNSTQPWMISFVVPYAPSNKKFSSNFFRAANHVEGVVKFGKIDASNEPRLAELFGITSYPSVKYFGSSVRGTMKNIEKANNYILEHTAAAFVKFAYSLMPYADVRMITTTEQFAELTSESKAAKEDPSIAYLPKVFLFSDKSSPSALWRAVAHYHIGRVGCVQIGPNLEKVWSVFNMTDDERGVALILTSDWEKSGIQKFMGELTFTPITLWISHTLAGGNVDLMPEVKDAEEMVATVITKNAILLENQAEFEEGCLKKRGICVIAMLPPDSHPLSGEYKYAKLMNDLARKFKSSSFHFLIMHSVHQVNFVQKLNRYEGDLNMIAFSPRNNQYATYIGAFTLKGMADFLDKVAIGRAKTNHLKVVPTLVDVKPEKFKDDL